MNISICNKETNTWYNKCHSPSNDIPLTPTDLYIYVAEQNI